MSFHILTDSCTDFPLSYVQSQTDLTILPLTYEIEGTSYTPDGTDDFTRAFYKELRDGKVAKTSQVNMETWKKAFKTVLSNGQDALCIVFSGALSGTYLAAAIEILVILGIFAMLFNYFYNSASDNDAVSDF